MSSTRSNFGGFIFDSAYSGILLICAQTTEYRSLESRIAQTDLAACSHHDVAHVILLADDPPSEVALPVIWYPHPFLLVELGLEGCCAGSLCTV